VHDLAIIFDLQLTALQKAANFCEFLCRASHGGAVMFNRVAYGVFVILGCLLVCLLIVGSLGKSLATSAVAGKLVSGRTVTTSSDGWTLHSRYSQDTATIKTSGHTIIVAPKQLMVDGAIYATIAEEVQSVSVTVEDHAVSFTADGKPVAPLRR
jgi:hypothetical protein